MIHSNVETFRWNTQTQQLEILDQLALPEMERFVPMKTVDDFVNAISDMLVRGAPAIGITAAYGIYYSARSHWNDPQKLALIQSDKIRLANTRPTAVNLFWALERIMKTVHSHLHDESPDAILQEAHTIWHEDVGMNLKMAEWGAKEIGNIQNILTHCNAGALATGGIGTALGVIRAIHENQPSLHVWVDETRPYLQGARLTSWELMKDGINCTLITDNMSAYLMKQGLVDAIIVGADRIAANHDIANKIGTYALAVLANYHKIPFYVAAPDSTFDPNIASGNEIVIEERSANEVVFIKNRRIAPEGVKVRHPAFDVTPHELITGIITPNGVIHCNS